MTDLLTDLPALLALYDAPDNTGQYNMAALYDTLAPLVDEGTLSRDTANGLLDFAAALTNYNAGLAEVEAIRAETVARDKARVQVPRWLNETTVTALLIAQLVAIMAVSFAAMLS